MSISRAIKKKKKEKRNNQKKEKNIKKKKNTKLKNIQEIRENWLFRTFAEIPRMFVVKS